MPKGVYERSAAMRAKMSASARERASRPEWIETCRKGGLASGGFHGRHTDATKAKMRAAKLGKPGPWTGKTRGPLSAEWRGKISAANFGKPASYPMRRFYYGSTAFRSSWEVRAAQAFDALGIAWKYEPCRFHLGSQSYTPDFYLPTEDLYVEIKGYYGPKSATTMSLMFDRHPEIPVAIILEPQLKALEALASSSAVTH